MTSNFIKNIGNFLYKNQWFTSRLFKANNNSLRIVYYHMISDINHPFYFNKKSISKYQFELHIKYFIKYFPDLGAEVFFVISKKAPPFGLPLPSSTALIIASEHSALVLK